jgi:hypothetical protein
VCRRRSHANEIPHSECENKANQNAQHDHNLGFGGHLINDAERQRSGTLYLSHKPAHDLKDKTAAFVGVACTDLLDGIMSLLAESWPTIVNKILQLRHKTNRVVYDSSESKNLGQCTPTRHKPKERKKREKSTANQIAALSARCLSTREAAPVA